MPIKFQALPIDHVRDLQAGGPDANGLIAERKISDGGGNPCRHCLTDIGEGGGGNPCRHCLTDIGEGETMLVLAYRPFPSPQPYAEVGPIFLCADRCERHPDSDLLPHMFRNRDRLLLRGYTSDDRIRYGTGQVVEIEAVEQAALEILANQEIAYVHMRSPTNNCYQCRIDRA